MKTADARRTVLADLPLRTLRLADLRIGDSPRQAGEDPAHTRMLAQLDGPYPPILVQLPSMRVFDGLHRVRAALSRGDQTIDARCYEGDTDTAFILAVAANSTHGLPLCLADRRAAARRILRSHPEWSDRGVGAAAGLAASTVRSLRQHLLDGTAGEFRVGRDGRLHPLNCTEGRRLAGLLLTRDPGMSLRRVAREAGISPATVQDVRDRLRNGEDPALASPRGPRRAARPRSAPQVPVDEPADMLRFKDSGRALLAWLQGRAVAPEEYAAFVDHIPPHCTGRLAQFARSCAEIWSAFADELEQRSETTSFAGLRHH